MKSIFGGLSSGKREPTQEGLSSGDDDTETADGSNQKDTTTPYQDQQNQIAYEEAEGDQEDEESYYDEEEQPENDDEGEAAQIVSEDGREKDSDLGSGTVAILGKNLMDEDGEEETVDAVDNDTIEE